ncbi:hypothetical protein Tco_1240374, partial [Tanacetum coccineum]
STEVTVEVLEMHVADGKVIASSFTAAHVGSKEVETVSVELTSDTVDFLKVILSLFDLNEVEVRKIGEELEASERERDTAF